MSLLEGYSGSDVINDGLMLFSISCLVALDEDWLKRTSVCHVFLSINVLSKRPLLSLVLSSL